MNIRTNYGILYDANKICRDATLAFIRRVLKQSFGDDWWEKGVKPVFKPEDIARLEDQFNRRFDDVRGPRRPGNSLEEILDLNYFQNIFEKHWKQSFAVHLAKSGKGQVTLDLFRQIVDYRNAVAHSESGDLSFDDTFRGLDNIDRFLSLFDLVAGETLVSLKSELKAKEHLTTAGKPDEVKGAAADTPPPTMSGGAEGGSSHDGGKDSDAPSTTAAKKTKTGYELGFEQLEQAIISKSGQGESDHLRFLGYHRTFKELLTKERDLGPLGDTDKQERRKLLLELDQLSINYLNLSFDDACEPPGRDGSTPRPVTPKDIGALQAELKKLESNIDKKRVKQALNTDEQSTNPQTEKKIAKWEREVEEVKKQIELLKPTVYFSLKRQFFSPDTHQPVSRCVEEQEIEIRLTVTNLGTKKAHINLIEQPPKSFQIIFGDLTVTTNLDPGELKISTYRCLPTVQGKFTFAAELKYARQVSGWDDVDSTPLEVFEGTKPKLVVKRCYRELSDGLEILLHLKNTGDKIARRVKLSESIEVTGGEPITFQFGGDILGGKSVSLKANVKVRDVGLLVFPGATRVEYSQSNKQSQHVLLEPKCERLEYDFSTIGLLIGRQGELESIEQFVAENRRHIAQPDRITYPPKLLVISGKEGSGKSNLLRRVVELACDEGFSLCIEEDIHNRMPVKQAFRQLIHIPPGNIDRDALMRRLSGLLPDEHDKPLVYRLFRYIASSDVMGSDMTEDRQRRQNSDLLRADLLRLLRTICTQPLIFAFENAHIQLEGLERDLLAGILQAIAIDTSLPVIACITSRPVDNLDDQYVGRIAVGVPHKRCIRLELDNLSLDESCKLCDALVPFPIIDTDLQLFCFKRTSGNPFALIELLRTLTDYKKQLVQRVENEWRAHPQWHELEQAIPAKIEEIVVNRARELGTTEFEVLQSLSVIGFEFQTQIVEPYLIEQYPSWQSRDIDLKLRQLKRAGFLVETEVGFKFEHELKREALYDSLKDSDPNHVKRLRSNLAKILIEGQDVGLDEDERVRQAGRHIFRALEDTKKRFLDTLVKAAQLEVRNSRFDRGHKYFEEAIRIETDAFKTADIYIEWGRLCQLSGQWALASTKLDAAKRCMDMVKRDREQKQRQRDVTFRIEKEMGRVLLQQGQLKESIALLDKSKERLECLFPAGILPVNIPIKRYIPPKDLGFFTEICEVYLSLVEAGLELNDKGLVKRSAREAERYARQAFFTFDNAVLLKQLYVTLGEKCTREESFDAALEWYSKALDVAATPRDEYIEERALSGMATVYLNSGKHDQALDMYRKAIRVQLRLNDLVGMAISYSGIGQILVDDKRTAETIEATEACNNALKYAREVGDIDLTGRAHLNLFELLAERGEPEQSLQYWSEAKVILRTRGLMNTKIEDRAYQVLEKLQATFRRNGDKERIQICAEDMPSLFNKWDSAKEAMLQIALGEADFDVRQYSKAQSAFEEALELGGSNAFDTIALANERLGDLYSVYHPDNRPTVFGQKVGTQEEPRAEDYYEAAIQQYLKGSDENVLTVFSKLIGRLVKDEFGLSYLPQVFWRLIRDVAGLPTSNTLVDKLCDVAETRLVENKRFAEAGDVLVFTFRARIQGRHVERDRLLDYLERAKAHYYEAPEEDRAEGLYTLISSYQRIGAWRVVVLCFEELLELSVNAEDTEGFNEAFSALPVLYEFIDVEEFERLIDIAVTARRRIVFPMVEDGHACLNIAKCCHHMSVMTDDKIKVELLRDSSLEWYSKVDKLSPEVKGVVLHDTALIYRAKGDKDTALALLTEAIRVAQANGESTNVASSQVIRAKCYLDMDKPALAEEDFREAIQSFEKKNQHWDRRLQAQDERPLAPNDVKNMYADKNWLVSAYLAFAWSYPPIPGIRLDEVMMLMQRAARICREIGRPIPFQIDPKMLFQIRQKPCADCGAPIDLFTARCTGCSKPVCIDCGTVVTPSDESCSRCGSKLGFYCEHCNGKVLEHDSFCMHCSEPLVDDDRDQSETWSNTISLQATYTK